MIKESGINITRDKIERAADLPAHVMELTLYDLRTMAIDKENRSVCVSRKEIDGHFHKERLYKIIENIVEKGELSIDGTSKPIAWAVNYIEGRKKAGKE